MYRFPLIILAFLVLVFGVFMLLANFLHGTTADRYIGVVSERISAVSELAPAFKQCGGKAQNTGAKSYIGCQAGCICKKVNQYYSQCAPPGKHTACNEEAVMPMILDSKKKYEDAKKATNKARRKKNRFKK